MGSRPYVIRSCRLLFLTQLPRFVWSVLLLPVAIGVSGCGPSKDELRLNRAMYLMRSECRPDYHDAIDILEKMRNDKKHESEFVQYAMIEITAGMLGGYYEHLAPLSKHAHLAVKKYQDADAETRAAWGREDVKFFKGEPHERSLLALYTGLICYQYGQYNDARIFFTQSILAAATRDDDMAEFRDDFRLGHYWLGRAYMKLGQHDNARIAFEKASHQMRYPEYDKDRKKITAERTKQHKHELKGEAACYKKWSRGKSPIEGIADLSTAVARADVPAILEDAADPDPCLSRAADWNTFLDPKYQEAANLIILVETGRGPIKYLRGSSKAIDEYMKNPSREINVDIFIDGHRAGPGFCLTDTYHQAVTRGVKTRRGRQVGKAVTKAILTRTPLIGGFFGYWDIEADARHWTSLPDRIHVFAVRCSPGLHTIHFKFFDINDQYLPRYDLIRHHINVPDTGDILLLVHSAENQNNAYVLAHLEEE